MDGLRGVIMDVDGTLVDSNRQHAKAWYLALKENGFRVAYREIRLRVGMGKDKIIPTLTNISADSPAGKRIAESKRKIFDARFFSRIRAFPWVPELVTKLKQLGFRVAAASSADREEVDRLLAVAEVDSELDAVVASNGSIPSKPDPDVLLRAARALDLLDSETLVVGDSPYDVAAAARAHMPCIALCCGGWKPRKLAGAVAIYADPKDFYLNLESSPLLEPVAS